MKRRQRRSGSAGRTPSGRLMVKSLLDSHTELASELLGMVRARDTGDPTHRFQIAGVMVFLAGVDKALSLVLHLLYLAGCVDWGWLTGSRKTELLPGEVECGRGLMAKLFKIKSLGLDLTGLDWLVELRNLYVHDCSIYAGYKVSPEWGERPRLRLRASGPEVSTSQPPLAAIDAAVIQTYADDLARRLGSLLDRHGWSAAWRALQERLSQLPEDPEPELSRVASGTPEVIHECVTALNQRYVGDGLRKLL